MSCFWLFYSHWSVVLVFKISRQLLLSSSKRLFNKENDNHSARSCSLCVKNANKCLENKTNVLKQIHQVHSHLGSKRSSWKQTFRDNGKNIPWSFRRDSAVICDDEVNGRKGRRSKHCFGHWFWLMHAIENVVYFLAGQRWKTNNSHFLVFCFTVRFSGAGLVQEIRTNRPQVAVWELLRLFARPRFRGSTQIQCKGPWDARHMPCRSICQSFSCPEVAVVSKGRSRICSKSWNGFAYVSPSTNTRVLALQSGPWNSDPNTIISGMGEEWGACSTMPDPPFQKSSILHENWYSRTRFSQRFCDQVPGNFRLFRNVKHHGKKACLIQELCNQFWSCCEPNYSDRILVVPSGRLITG